MNYLIDSMQGLGDNIYQRHIVKSLSESGNNIWITTSWPEIYSDLENVRFLKPETKLRTQSKNILRNTTWESSYPRDCLLLPIRYGAKDMPKGSILKTMESRAGFKVREINLTLPDFGRVPEIIGNRGKPIAVIRPVTARKEWLNNARSPKPEYISQVAIDLLSSGFWVVSVADIDDSSEWLVGEAPPASQRLHKGELSVIELLALIQGAKVVVGGVGWIVPACLAAKTNLYCILGGQGGHNSPRHVADPRMDLSRIRFATPDRFCMCDRMDHDCDKEISNIDYSFSCFLNQLK